MAHTVELAVTQLLGVTKAGLAAQSGTDATLAHVLTCERVGGWGQWKQLLYDGYRLALEMACNQLPCQQMNLPCVSATVC